MVTCRFGRTWVKPAFKGSVLPVYLKETDYNAELSLTFYGERKIQSHGHRNPCLEAASMTHCLIVKWSMRGSRVWEHAAKLISITSVPANKMELFR